MVKSNKKNDDGSYGDNGGSDSGTKEDKNRTAKKTRANDFVYMISHRINAVLLNNGGKTFIESDKMEWRRKHEKWNEGSSIFTSFWMRSNIKANYKLLVFSFKMLGFHKELPISFIMYVCM